VFIFTLGVGRGGMRELGLVFLFGGVPGRRPREMNFPDTRKGETPCHRSDKNRFGGGKKGEAKKGAPVAFNLPQSGSEGSLIECFSRGEGLLYA